MISPVHTHLCEHLMATFKTHSHQLDVLATSVGATIAPTHNPTLVSPFTYEGPFMPASPVSGDQYLFDVSLADFIHEYPKNITCFNYQQ